MGCAALAAATAAAVALSGLVLLAVLGAAAFVVVVVATVLPWFMDHAQQMVRGLSCRATYTKNHAQRMVHGLSCWRGLSCKGILHIAHALRRKYVANTVVLTSFKHYCRLVIFL